MPDVRAVALTLFAMALPIYSQTVDPESLSGPDSHELGPSSRRYLFGNWGGLRSRLAEKGVDFDLQYISDALGNIAGDRNARLAMWNRVRGTVDIDFGRLIQQSGWFFHITALWQGGGNLGAYLGSIASPSGMSSENTFRLDSWWLEKRWFDQRLVVRAGQFAGQDFYGAQHYAASFIFEPMGYALNNLSNTIETFDPPSTPAAEVRVAPARHVYMKSMVMAADRAPFSHNQTGLVPQFRGSAVTANEIAFTPGTPAGAMRAFDNVESRNGYSGLYRFGGVYNPGTFTGFDGVARRSGNYLLYWMAYQALWRVHPRESRGLDATVSYDWSPSDVNRNNRVLTAGLRFNEPLPYRFHNSVSVGYVQNSLSDRFLPPGTASWKPEHGAEVNMLLMVTRMVLFQPVLQYYTNIGGGAQRAVVLGFRTKVEL
ncbi:MAG: carbohydrate porin [Ignavibacteriota bacterium]